MAAPVGAVVNVRVDLRALAHLIGWGSLIGAVLLVLHGWTWCVLAVAVSGYTLGLLSGVTWFLDPWMAAMYSRRRRDHDTDASSVR